MLKKNEKFILKQVVEAKDSFEKMIAEMKTFANSTMKRIFNKKAIMETETSANMPSKEQKRIKIEKAF